MGKIWKLIKANARKDRGQLVLFFMILTLAGLLLHMALIVNDYGNIYEKRKESRNIADAFCFGNFDDDEVAEALKKQENVESFWINEVVIPGSMTVTTCNSKKEKIVEDFIILENRDSEYVHMLDFLESEGDVRGEKICLNLYTARNLGVCLGDEITMDSEYFGKHEFVVAGIYEDLIMGNSFSRFSILLEKDCFSEFKEKALLLSQEFNVDSLRDVIGVYTLGDGLSNAEWEKITLLDQRGKGLFEVGDALCAAYVSVVNVLAAFMAAFSAIIILVTITTIAFTIGNNVDKDIRNLGALRAVGFTTAQLREAIMAEFTILAFLATATGIVLSYVVYPVIERAYIQEQTGMAWKGSLNVWGILLLLVTVNFFIMLITYFATRRIKHLSPATALRFGLSSNSFRKNYLPLSETKGGLNGLLAIKSCLQGGKQNLTVFFAMLLVSFVATFAAMLYFNTQVDVTKFQHLIQGDVPDAMVTISAKNEEELQEIKRKLFEIDGVKQVYGLGSASGHLGEEYTTIIYSDSCKDVYCGLYEGTMALEDNEAVIAGGLAEKLGVGVGDEIEVEFGEEKARFLVTGLQQAVYGMGTRVYLTEGGARRIGIPATFTYFRVRLEHPSAEAVDVMLDAAREKLGDACTKVENYYRFQRSMDNMPVMAVSFIVLLLVLLSGMIAILVLSLIIKNVFVKKEKEFGIKKALGFTSTQLRLQLALSLSAIVFLAAIIGGVLGYYLTNPLITQIFWGFGIKKAELYVRGSMSVAAGCAVVLFTLLISYLAARKMKKVSAYELIRE